MKQNNKLKAKTKRKRTMISQSFLDLIHFGDDVDPSQLRTKHKRQLGNKTNVEDKIIVVQQTSESKNHEEEMSPAIIPIPNLPPNSKKIIDIIIEIDVDSAFK